MDDVMPLAADLNDLGLHVAVFSWRGCEVPDPTRVTGGVHEHEDLRAVVKAVRGHMPNGHVALLGMSFGGTMALRVAAEDAGIAALWMDCPYADPMGFLCDRVTARLHLPGQLFVWPAALMGWLRFGLRIWAIDPEGWARATTQPTTIVLAGKDRLLSSHQSDRLRRAGSWGEEQTWVWPDTEHASAYDDDRVGYIARAAAFFGTALGCLPDVATWKVAQVERPRHYEVVRSGWSGRRRWLAPRSAAGR
jgi:alpha-beta hydrolase superfamily lysophospholipase